MNDEPLLIQPEENDPNKEQRRAFWRKLGRDIVRGSLDTVDEASRQILAVDGILVGLYANAIAFSGLRESTQTAGLLGWYLAPVALLFLSLIFALLVFFPDLRELHLDSSTEIREKYQAALTKKFTCMRVASVFLVLGVGAIFIALLVYIQTAPLPAAP